MAGLRRLKLNALNIEITNSMIVGVIVSKSSVKIFRSRKNNDEVRGVWNFTLRDSSVDVINGSVFGSSHFVLSFDEMFHVGDVVTVLSPCIKTRQLDDGNEQYQPQVSSPFNLVLNERSSEMSIYDGEDYGEYKQLLHIPTKPFAGYFTLSDVENNAQDIRGDTIDLLVAVRNVLPIRHIKSKSGEDLQFRDIHVMDQSSSVPFKIMLSDSEIIKISSNWQPRETILFISDVKLEWNAFYKSVVGRVNRRTIITEDPHTSEAEALRVFARHVPLEKNAVLDQISQNIPDPNSIRTVMTVQQVLDRAKIEENAQFTALMYVMVTHIDLDGLSKLTAIKCGNCSSVLKGPNFLCDNAECSSTMGTEMLESEPSFDIRVTLTDHTGSLTNCRLTGKFAEKTLGCNVNEFSKMNIDEKGQLKWKLLMERCATRIVVMKGPLVSIIACSISDINEVVSKLPIY